MRLAAAIIAVLVALYALHRLALWLEGRGHLYYRHRRPSSSSLGTAFLEIQALMEPGKRQLLEAQREERTEQSESGDPPQPGADDQTTGGDDDREGGS